MTPDGTTVVAVRRRKVIALASDGQTSYGNIALITDSRCRAVWSATPSPAGSL